MVDCFEPMLACQAVQGLNVASELERLECGGGFVGEVKYDGMRVVTVVENGLVVKMRSRGMDVDQKHRFPEVVKELESQVSWPRGRTVVDGELGFLTSGLVMDVNVVQGRASKDRLPIKVHAFRFPFSMLNFDVLVFGGRDVQSLPFVERRALLESIPGLRVVEQSPLLLDLYERVVGAGGEGIVVKRLDGKYEQAERVWMKFKAPSRVDHLHVVGLVEGDGWRAGLFGALILAKKVGDGFEYVCKAGAGLSRQDLVRVLEWSESYRTVECPFELSVVKQRVKKPVITWLREGIVADIRYDEAVKEGPRYPRVINVTRE